MDNQHRKIEGYRELSQTEIDLINEIKAKGVELGSLVAKLKVRAVRQRLHAISVSEIERLVETEPEYWVEIGKRHLQEGLMALTRSVAQPTSF